MSKRPIDLHDLLRRAGRKEWDALDKMPPQAKKTFAPRVVMRWQSSGRDSPELQLKMTNEFVNRHLDRLNDHPGLQYRLMCLAELPNQSHSWVPAPKLGPRNDKIVMWMWDMYPNHHYDEVDRIVSKMTKEEFMEMVDFMGVSNDDRKEIVAAWKKREAAK